MRKITVLAVVLCLTGCLSACNKNSNQHAENVIINDTQVEDIANTNDTQAAGTEEQGMSGVGKTKSENMSETEIKTEAENKSQSQVESKTEIQSEVETKTKTETETEANTGNKTGLETKAETESKSKTETQSEVETISKVETTDRKLVMTVNGEVINITLYDTPAANALYEMLPLDLSFEDFNGIEKISYLSEKLPTQGEPDGCDPDVGDFCLYAPWGNLSIFYKDFRYSDSLIMLGHVDSGMDVIAGLTGNFDARLEK